jgi:hypothetical protein
MLEFGAASIMLNLKVLSALLTTPHLVTRARETIHLIFIAAQRDINLAENFVNVNYKTESQENNTLERHPRQMRL